jgi:probable addiction module antidote protein
MTKAPVKTIPWDPSERLDNPQAIALYLEAAFEDGDPALIVAALGDVARAIGMTQIARQAGVGRESLYKSLGPDGNPEFATIAKVLKAMGLKLTAEAA